MIDRSRTSDAPGCRTINGPEHEDLVQIREAIEVDGTILLPAVGFGVIDSQVEGDAPGSEINLVTIYVVAGRMGLAHHLSPNGAREVAKGLYRAADAAEQRVIEQAANAIAKARKQGGGA